MVTAETGVIMYLYMSDIVYCLQIQHCIADIPNLGLPDVCTATPLRGKAFCADHCQLLREQAPDVPTDLRPFLKYCGVSTHGNGMYSLFMLKFLQRNAINQVWLMRKHLSHSRMQSKVLVYKSVYTYVSLSFQVLWRC